MRICNSACLDEDTPSHENGAQQAQQGLLFQYI